MLWNEGNGPTHPQPEYPKITGDIPFGSMCPTTLLNLIIVN